MGKKNISAEETEKKNELTNESTKNVDSDVNGVHKNYTINQTISKKQAKEIGGPKGLEPTRYGDWEKRGRCIDF